MLIPSIPFHLWRLSRSQKLWMDKIINPNMWDISKLNVRWHGSERIIQINDSQLHGYWWKAFLVYYVGLVLALVLESRRQSSRWMGAILWSNLSGSKLTLEYANHIPNTNNHIWSLAPETRVHSIISLWLMALTDMKSLNNLIHYKRQFEGSYELRSRCVMREDNRQIDLIELLSAPNKFLGSSFDQIIVNSKAK